MATMRTGALGRIPDCQLHRRVIREKVRAATGNGGTQKGTFAHQRSESVTFARTDRRDWCTKGQFHVPDKGPSIRETLKLIMAMQMSSSMTSRRAHWNLRATRRAI